MQKVDLRNKSYKQFLIKIEITVTKIFILNFFSIESFLVFFFKFLNIVSPN